MSIFVVIFIIVLSTYTVRGDSTKNLNDGLHLGDASRLENVLRKALRGETLQMAIIGGSNSAAGRIINKESTSPLYYNVFSNWWKRNIADRKTGPGATLRKYVLAIGGMGSYFFAFCYKTFIPRPDEVLDIVLVEQSVNFITLTGTAEPLEQLTRQLLVHPSNPAIIFINLFSGGGKDPSTGKVYISSCANLEDYGQTEVERHYNITSISLRDIICPVQSKTGKRKLKNTANMFASDNSHIGIKGHALVAQLLISYVQNTWSDVIVGRSQINRQIPIVPPPIFAKVPLTVPLCWTLITPNKFQDIFHPSLAVGVQSFSGFKLSVDMKLAKSPIKTDVLKGWAATDVGSSVVFRVFVPPGSLRSVILLSRSFPHGGEAQVWLDDSKNLKIEISNSKSIYIYNQLFTVLPRVTPGYHYVTVKVIHRGQFVVSGLLVGPPDLDIKRVM